MALSRRSRHAKKGAGHVRAGQALRGSSEFHAWGDSNLYLRRNRARCASSSVTLGMAGAARCSTVRVISPLSRGSHDDGDAVAALQLAQIGEQRRHFAAGVLIDAMQAHEGIEDEQARVQFGDGRIEASAVGFKIEPHGGCGDDLDVEIGEDEAGGGADAVEPPAHDVERVLGGVKQNAPGAWHGEATQARNAGRDRDGEVQGEEGFPAFGSPPMIPTACSDHSPVTSQRCSSARSARCQAGSTGNRLIAVGPVMEDEDDKLGHWVVFVGKRHLEGLKNTGVLQ